MGKMRGREILSTALVFGVVQAGLFLAGWALGDLFVGLVDRIAHLIGFLLLLWVGGGMVLDGVRSNCEARDLHGLRNIIVAGIATSIDALAVGVSFSMDQLPLSSAILDTGAIFLVTILSVVVGLLGGEWLGEKFGRIAVIVGGIVLIFIGVSMLF